MLTTLEREVLGVIIAEKAAFGCAPTLQAIADKLGICAKSNVHRIMKRLEQKGYVSRLWHRRQACEVLKAPDDMKAYDVPALLARIRELESQVAQLQEAH